MGGEGTWLVDNGIYRSTFEATIETASSVLPLHIYSNLSLPEAWPLSNAYALAANKIMIVGQETLDNSTPLAGTSPYKAWAWSIGEAIAFDFALNAKQASNSFWRAYQEIVDALGLPSRRHSAWSNICKVQLLTAVNGSKSISKLPARERMVIVNWQRALFRAEVEASRPNAIIFLTGGMAWILKHMFDGVECVTTGPKGEEFDVLTCNELQIPLVQTYHPGAQRWGVKNVPERRAQAVAYLKQQLS